MFPLEYKGLKLLKGYRPDIVVNNQVVVECKMVSALTPVHDAQLLTYLKLGGWSLGLLINFNVALLKSGIHRRIYDHEKRSETQDQIVKSPHRGNGN
jgi:GxxExxY protein